MTSKNIQNLILRNAIDTTLSWTEWEDIEHIQTQTINRTLSKYSFPLFNCVLETHSDIENIDQVITDIIEEANKQSIQTAWFVSSNDQPENLAEILEKHGFFFAGNSFGMACLLKNLVKPEKVSKDLRIEIVNDHMQLQTWSDVLMKVLLFPEEIHEPWLELHKSIGMNKTPGWYHLIAYLADTAIGTASLYINKTGASLAHISVLPEYQKRGIASQLTWYAFTLAKKKGYQFGTLTASEEGFSVYQKLGFEKYSKMQLFIQNE